LHQNRIERYFSYVIMRTPFVKNGWPLEALFNSKAE